MNMETFEWQDGVHCPFHTVWNSYGTVSVDDSVYILGGLAHENFDDTHRGVQSGVTTVAKYQNDIWTRLGDLNFPRVIYENSHVILNGRELVIIARSTDFYADTT